MIPLSRIWLSSQGGTAVVYMALQNSRISQPFRNAILQATRNGLGHLCYGELDAAAHRVDALGADAHAVAEMPGKFFGFCAAATTRSGRAASPFSSRERDHCVIAFAEDDARARSVFQSVDGQQAFHKNFE